MPKLKLRSLQEAITCIQDTKTHSSTEADGIYSHFSHYLVNTPSSSASTSCRSKHSECLPELDVDEVPVLSHTTTHTTAAASVAPNDYDLVQRGASAVSSHRFFFSPHTTKSIMEEAGHRRGHRKTTKAAAAAAGVFCKESATTMAMASSDPYRDFRRSMEEMVEANCLQEWPQLQELLHCYLRLNDRRTHSIILLAFTDLLMCRMAQDKDSFTVTSPSSSPPSMQQ